MPNIQIKDVPPETHAVLSKRASDAGQSLQAYLLAMLTDLAGSPTLGELFDEIDQREGGGSLTPDEAVQLIREVREGH